MASEEGPRSLGPNDEEVRVKLGGEGMGGGTTAGSAVWLGQEGTKGTVRGHEVTARLGSVSGHMEVFYTILRAMGSHGQVHSRRGMW